MAFDDMTHKNGIDFSYTEEFNFANNLFFPDEISYSEGQALATSERYSYDYSKTSQTVTRRKFLQAKTYSINYQLNGYNSNNIIEDIYKLEDSVGQVGRLYFRAIDRGLVLVQGVSFALETDSLGEVIGCGVTLNITAGRIPRQPESQQVNRFKSQRTNNNN